MKPKAHAQAQETNVALRYPHLPLFWQMSPQTLWIHSCTKEDKANSFLTSSCHDQDTRSLMQSIA